MRRIGLILLALLAWQLSVSGFVATPDSAGRLPRWQVVTPSTSSADTNQVNPVTKAIRYFIAAEAYSTTNRTAEINCVRGCFAQWQAIPGTILKFEEGGLPAGLRDVDTFDTTNTIFWAKTSTIVNGGYDNISGALGMAIYSYYNDNSLAECDIVMNAVQYKWSTQPVNSSDSTLYYIEPILLHEIGHFIGLDHSPVGGATMMSRGESGAGLGTGLTTDEIAAARTLYARSDWAALLGGISGKITMNGAGILGAVVTVEDTLGNMISGTVSRTSGAYELPSLPPGPYRLRVSPLDPVNAGPYLLAGVDISRDTVLINYGAAQTAFLATTGTAVTVTGGKTAAVNVNVTAGNPTFRITRLWPPTTNSTHWELYNAALSLAPGQSNYYIGVYSSTLPTSGATLSIAGNGITVGPTKFYPAITSGYNLIWATVSVASDTAPGMYTLVVQRGNDYAYANGFLVVPPLIPDVNFDGLDDQFQRAYFPLFTIPEAGPMEDPDHDGFMNIQEYLAGTNPTNAASYLRFTRVLNGNPPTLEWEGAANKKYQIYTRDSLANGTWQPLESIVVGTGPTNQWQDSQTNSSQRFYWLQAEP